MPEPRTRAPSATAVSQAGLPLPWISAVLTRIEHIPAGLALWPAGLARRRLVSAIARLRSCNLSRQGRGRPRRPGGDPAHWHPRPASQGPGSLSEQRVLVPEEVVDQRWLIFLDGGVRGRFLDAGVGADAGRPLLLPGSAAAGAPAEARGRTQRRSRSGPGRARASRGSSRPTPPARMKITPTVCRLSQCGEPPGGQTAGWRRW